MLRNIYIVLPLEEKPLIHATANDLLKHLDYPSLILAIKKAFVDSNIEMPPRHHYSFGHENQNNLLLMPSWSTDKYVGVKIITIFPENRAKTKPTIQGSYMLFDASNGEPLLICDAKLITLLRTAATSALASEYLSRKNSESLLMIGTGSLAPFLVKAHCAVRPIKTVFVWGRNFLKAGQVVAALQELNIDVIAVEYLSEYTPKADIISAATMSSDPLVQGEWVENGTHVDLVGSYLPTMRESDDALMSKARVYVDDLDASMKEAGDLILPLRKGILRKSQIKASLYDLCRIKKLGRATQKEITVFKSVGLALEDLAAAGLLYERMKKEKAV